MPRRKHISVGSLLLFVKCARGCQRTQLSVAMSALLVFVRPHRMTAKIYVPVTCIRRTCCVLRISCHDTGASDATMHWGPKRSPAH